MMESILGRLGSGIRQKEKCCRESRPAKTPRETNYVPVPAKTTAMVRRMILKSSQMLQFSM
jgi:hypothetical protein